MEESNTRIKQTLNELTRAQQQLVHAEKLASVGQLAAGVAHEINNPTGFVMGNIEVLGEYKDSILAVLDQYSNLEKEIEARHDKTLMLAIEKIQAFKAEHDLDYILTDMGQLLKDSLNGTVRIQKIVQDLKNFSSIDGSDHQQVDLNADVIETALRLVRSQLESKCTIHKSLSPLPAYNCRPAELSQVIMNLIINASEAIKDQGDIRVSSKCEGDNIKIQVADNGGGIGQDDILKLFDPFYTTKEIGKGTGLGLSISHGIVKNHGGQLSVNSKLGKGTIFTVLLPVDNP